MFAWEDVDVFMSIVSLGLHDSTLWGETMCDPSEESGVSELELSLWFYS